MAHFEERTKISQFDIRPDGCIGVRKTIEVLKDGTPITSTYWRCVLVPNDPQAESVLDEPYYANLAQQAWTEEVVAAYALRQAALAQQPQPSQPEAPV